MNQWFVILLIVGLAAIMLAHAGYSEGFQSGHCQKCGVDMPECSEGLKCMNGCCQRLNKKDLPPNELEVVP